MTDICERLDLTALQQTIGSLNDGLEVVNNPQWFNQQIIEQQKLLIQTATALAIMKTPMTTMMVFWM